MSKSTNNSYAQDEHSSPSSEIESFPPIVSIEDANNRLSEWDKKNADLPKFILDSIEKDAANGTLRTITGSADEYHNLACEFGRNSLYNGGAYISSVGAQIYLNNVDLLADCIQFSSKSQDWDICINALNRLNSIPRERWNWRAYTFVINYLSDRMEVEGNNKNAEMELLGYIDAYKSLDDERAWKAEADYYIRHGNVDKAIMVLKECVERVRVVPQVCLSLSDLLLQKGEYSDVVKYSAIGVRSTAQDQPSASTGYLIYVCALAKDALIHEEEIAAPGAQNSGFQNMEKVLDALSDYELAQSLLSTRVFLANIDQRMRILRKKGKVPSNQSENDSDDNERISRALAEALLRRDNRRTPFPHELV